MGALDKVLTVLEALVAGSPGTSLASIAERSGLGKPTTHRILGGLAVRGYAVRTGDGSYRPGPQILAMAGQVIGSMDYKADAHEVLLKLQQTLPETIHFALLTGRELCYVDKIEARGAYRMASMIGMRLPLHSTANGKVLLANVPPAERQALLEGRPLVARTGRTITDPDRFELELAEVAARGFAVDDEENEDGVRCVAAPVLGYTGTAVGGISVSVPAFQMTVAEVSAMAPEVIKAAREVSRLLGAPPAATGRRDGAETASWSPAEASRGGSR